MYDYTPVMSTIITESSGNFTVSEGADWRAEIKSNEMSERNFIGETLYVKKRLI
jgi:hypothetical protein